MPLSFPRSLGEAAVKFEQTPLSEALPQVMKVLREIHEPKGIYVPEPLQVSSSRCCQPYSCYPVTDTQS